MEGNEVGLEGGNDGCVGKVEGEHEGHFVGAELSLTEGSTVGRPEGFEVGTLVSGTDGDVVGGMEGTEVDKIV